MPARLATMPKARRKEARIGPLAARVDAVIAALRAALATPAKTSSSALLKKRNLRQLVKPCHLHVEGDGWYNFKCPDPGLLSQ
jgi:hypothetical protein